MTATKTVYSSAYKVLVIGSLEHDGSRYLKAKLHLTGMSVIGIDVCSPSHRRVNS